MTPIPLTPPAALTPENLADLARSCHADSVAAGWWEPLEYAADKAREQMRADIIGSEVGEALDALRRPERPLAYLDDKGKPDGYLVEVADAAIRALDLLGRVMDRKESSGLPTLERPTNRTDGMYLGEWHHKVWHQINCIANIQADYGMMFVRNAARVSRLCEVVFLCADETAAHGADLVTLINIKRAFNRTRGTRHGGMSV